MKDKEKQIEEMAEILLQSSYAWWREAPNGTTKKEYQATTLYNADYRKLPKDSVVLSREEYERFIATRYIIKPKRLSKEELDKYLENSAWRIIDNDTIEIMSVPSEEQIRKETADNIFKKLITRLKDCPEVIEEGYNVQNSVDYFEDIIGYDKFCADETIKKLANEFGVEIKE